MKLQQYCIRKYRPLEIQHFFNIIYLWNRLSKNCKSLSDSALLKTIFIFRKKLFSQNIELLQYCDKGTNYVNIVMLGSIFLAMSLDFATLTSVKKVRNLQHENLPIQDINFPTKNSKSPDLDSRMYHMYA